MQVDDNAQESEPPPDYGEVCEQQSNEHMIEGLTPVHLLEPTVVPPPTVDPTYQEVVELPDANTAPTSHVELVTNFSPSLPAHSIADSAPIPGPIYQEVGELPERRTPVNETDNQENGITEANCLDEHDSEVRLTPVQAVASDSTGTATLPLYQEVSNVVQNGVPTDSNKVADDSDLIELSETRDLSAVGNDIEEVDGRFSPPQFIGASEGPFGGIHPDRLYDEVTERPRVISPANFVEAANISPESNIHASPVQNAIQNVTTTLPLPISQSTSLEAGCPRILAMISFKLSTCLSEGSSRSNVTTSLSIPSISLPLLREPCGSSDTLRLQNSCTSPLYCSSSR